MVHEINEIISEIPFELVLVLGFVIICSLIARRYNQPAVIGCFIGGFIIHVLVTIPGINFTAEMPLNPQIIMLMIALLIYNEGMHVDMDNLLENKEEILTLSVLGTLIAVIICAFLFTSIFGIG